MRTTMDLPEEVLRRAKIAAVERGATLRQVIIDALQRELDASARPRRRLTTPPVHLSKAAPLRRLHPDEVKQLDADAMSAADEAKARRAMHR